MTETRARALPGKKGFFLVLICPKHSSDIWPGKESHGSLVSLIREREKALVAEDEIFLLLHFVLGSKRIETPFLYCSFH